MNYEDSAAQRIDIDGHKLEGEKLKGKELLQM